MARMSTASRSMMAIIGWRTVASYSSRRALNHSRRLFRFSRFRNDRVAALKRGEPAGMLSGGLGLLRLEAGHSRLLLPREVRHDTDHALHQHQLRAVVHLVLLGGQQHVEPRARWWLRARLERDHFGEERIVFQRIEHRGELLTRVLELRDD